MKDPKNVTRYCIDCKSYNIDTNNEPCKSCVKDMRNKPNWNEVKEQKNRKTIKQATFI